MSHFLVFGTHPRLSLAELRAVKPRLARPRTIGACALVEDADWDGDALMKKLGGTVKLGEVAGTIPTDRLNGERIVERLLERKSLKTDAAVDFGLMIVGGSGSNERTKRIGMEAKRAFKANGVKSRWVTSEGAAALTPAAVAKLKLTTDGFDIVVIIDGAEAHVGLTTHVQDADAWSLRDYGRPVRDDRAGMLPPKLARMMVNLARVPDGGTVFDPFCGNGTILMEAALATRASKIVGSDIDAKQVASTKRNTEWLVMKNILVPEDAERMEAFEADARAPFTSMAPASVNAIVTEGALGPPLRGGESQARLDANRAEIERLWTDALAALRPLLAPKARLVLVWPSFKTDHGMARVELDAQVGRLGYALLNPLDSWDDSGGPLLYHRAGQRVARRIVILERAPS